MYLINEKNQEIKLEQIKASLGDLTQIKVPTLEELQNVLGDYYHEALQKEASVYQFALTSSDANLSFIPDWGKKLWELIRKGLCALLTGTSTLDEIIKVVTSLLTKFIPGGWLLDKAVELVVKYFKEHGYGNLCPVN